MKHAHFINRLDDAKILAAIAGAEAKSTGHIRVLVSKRRYTNALAAAEKHFKALGLNKNPLGNSVLIFVAPKSHTFAIYGGPAIHARCGPEFWNILRDEMTTHLKDSRYTDAILHGINKAGELLAVHFPREN